MTPRKSENSQPLLKRGRHSKVYLIGRYAIKVFDSRFEYNFRKEAKFLTLLQPFRFVPELYFVDFEGLKLVMQRIEGCSIREAMSAEIAARCLEICYLLDVMGIQKEEMNHPDKHIIVSDSVYFIDFERSYFSKKPANVTQFCAYLRRFGFEVEKNILRDYKRSYSREVFEVLKRSLSNEVTPHVRSREVVDHHHCNDDSHDSVG
ncbi:MAG: hypothetical protein ABWW66_02050 [Archaeoglobaceae archaeon]